jgi:hypothetical protein
MKIANKYDLSKPILLGILFLIFSGVAFILPGCKSKVVNSTPLLDFERPSFAYVIYNNYCFSHSGKCTEDLLIRVISKSPYSAEEEKIIYSTEIKPIKVKTSTDQEIIEMFLQSLECYNYISQAAGYNFNLDYGLFFKGKPNKKTYSLTSKEYGTIELINLEELDNFNFKGQVKKSTIKNGKIEVDFGNGVKMVCEPDFYKYFSYRYINFLTPNPKLTPYQITEMN